MSFRKSLILLGCLSLSTMVLADPPSYLEQYRALKVEGVNATGDFMEFRDRARAGAKTVIHMTGNSSAGYGSMESFKSDFLTFLHMQAVKGPVSIVLGGTTAGFGAAYEFASEYKELSGREVKINGMVASQAVEFAGDISSKNENLLLVDTYTDINGERSWELKKRGADFSMTATFSIHTADYHVVQGGGEIAFKEGIEVLSRMAIEEGRIGSNKSLELVLIVGDRPGNIAKDSGYRASSQLLYLLSTVPSLVPSNVQVTIYESGKVGRNLGYNLDNFPRHLLSKANGTSFSAADRFLEKAVNDAEKASEKRGEAFLSEVDKKAALDAGEKTIKEKFLLTKAITKNTFMDAKAVLKKIIFATKKSSSLDTESAVEKLMEMSNQIEQKVTESKTEFQRYRKSKATKSSIEKSKVNKVKRR